MSNYNPPVPADKTLLKSLGIIMTKLEKNCVEATMPVDERTHQVYGILHGGASAALAETVGSVAANLNIDPDKQNCVGIELNCSHLKAKRNGLVTGTATPIRLGRSVHVWNIDIVDETKNLICKSRLTMAIVDKKFG